ncbi:MAG: hypothetical protein CXT73_05010 [Methanobacteriota archaeon]|nr:MAG: hypothetical protein CXT73_05010 [Euryarchaeota archaeon]
MPKQNDIYSKATRKNGKDKLRNSHNRTGKYSSRSIRIKTQEMMNKSKNERFSKTIVAQKKQKKK